MTRPKTKMQKCPALAQKMVFYQVLGINWRTFGVIVVLSLTIANATAASDSSDLLARISKALSQRDTQSAERLISVALAQPDLTKSVTGLLLLDRAKTRELQDRLEDALVDFSTAIQNQFLTQTEHIDALLERGLLLDALNRPDDAIGDFSAALQLDPKSASALNYRASIYRRQGHTSEAQLDYRAALAADSAGAEYSYFGLGQIEEAQGDIVGARDFYAKALAADPKYSLALDRLKSLGGISQPTPGSGGRPLASASVSDHTPLIAPPPITSATQPPQLRPTVDTSAEGTVEHVLRPSSVDRATSPNGSAQVQLGVWSSEGKAAAVWAKAVHLMGKPLEAMSPSIIPVDLPGRGQLFRLRVTIVTNAVDFCASLKAAGFDCIPVRP